MFLLTVGLIIAIYYGVRIYFYNKTTYRAVTHNSFFITMRDKGRRGEFEIYRLLKSYEKQGYRFLFNVYLPKANAKTTELDVLMIGPEAVYVFESKNYSGWIFGNDKQKNWTQVLPTGRGSSQKERFYNPVWQNRTHCNVLREYLPQGAPVYSVVLFSNRCTFKDVSVNAPDVVVAHRNQAGSVVEYYIKNSQAWNLDVEKIYETLYPFSQATQDVKQAHIEEIRTLQ